MAYYATDDVLPQNIIKRDVWPQLMKLRPNVTPLLTLINALATTKQKQLKIRSVKNRKFEWMEQADYTYYTMANGTHSASGTTINVDDGSIFTKYDLMRNIRTSEVMRVNATPAANAVQVVRGYPTGTTGTAAGVADDVMLRIGALFAEGDASRASRDLVRADKFNYTDITRTFYDYTRNTEGIDTYTGGNFSNDLKANAAIEHKLEIERKLIFSKLNKSKTIVVAGVAANKYVYSMSGILETIVTNITTDASGTLTKQEFNAFGKKAFRYGSKTKLLLAGPKIIEAFNFWADNKLVINDDTKKYGLNLLEWITPYGKFLLSLDAEVMNIDPSLQGTAICLDVPNIKLVRWMSDYMVHKPVLVDMDGKKFEYLSEVSMQMMNEQTHSLLCGVTDYS